jgi:two-component system sensor histidine kinase VicK
MKKTSSKQRFHNDPTNDRESSLSEGEWLDNDSLEDCLSDEQTLNKNVLADVNRENATGLQVQKQQHGLTDTYDTRTRRQSTQTKSENISILWHELLSPLTLIKGYTSTMLQLSEGITDEQKQQYLRGIDSASNRMVRLLEELRDVTRLEENGRIYPQHVSLRDLLREVLAEVQSQAEKHVIVFRPCAPLPRVKVDPDKIVQVVNNLVANAIKYSPEGGDIEVEVRLFRTDREFDRILGNGHQMDLNFPCLVISIADSGIGIPEAELDRIFDKFYRVNSKLTRAVPGVGLGLYICKMIVEAHNGHIWAGNAPAGGSVFSFSLPVG